MKIITKTKLLCRISPSKKILPKKIQMFPYISYQGCGVCKDNSLDDFSYSTRT